MKMFDKKDRHPAKKTANYASLFLRKKELQSRQCVYISQKVHSTVAKIVKMFSDRDITVGGYIDNILMEHLETHRDEIIELYQRQLKKESDNSLIEF
jgi:hypothetical protein